MLELIVTAVVGLAIAVFKVLLSRHDKAKKEATVEKNPAADNHELRDRLLDRVHERQDNDHVQS